MHLKDINELAKEAGLASYDTAIPLDWVNHARKIAPNSATPLAFAGIVWCYDKARVFGEPIGLTTAGRQLLELLDASGVAVGGLTP